MAPSTWLDIAPGSRFSLANIPLGIATFPESEKPAIATAIGGYAFNLAVFAAYNGFSRLEHDIAGIFDEITLNAMAARGRHFAGAIRRYLQDVLKANTPYPSLLRDNTDLRGKCIVPLPQVQPHLPFSIGGFSDFYGGINHARNAGALFRGQIGALPANWIHLPEAYHGRTSSIFVAGTPVRRPWGQAVEDINAAEKIPIFRPCQTMDFELEIGCFVCGGNKPGDRIPVNDAADNIFGFVLLNDWSARDIQRWEYVPLGPFNGKNFATTISAWVVLADALEPYRKAGIAHPGPVLPYLQETREDFTYDLNLEAQLVSGTTQKPTSVCRTNASEGIVWSFSQMLAQHTVTGCPLEPGDLLGSGTVSGSTPDSLGCLMEQNFNGKQTVKLEGREQRVWIEDGDEVVLRAWAGNEKDGFVGFGDCTGVLLPAHETA